MTEYIVYTTRKYRIVLESKYEEGKIPPSNWRNFYLFEKTFLQVQLLGFVFLGISIVHKITDMGVFKGCGNDSA